MHLLCPCSPLIIIIIIIIIIITAGRSKEVVFDRTTEAGRLWCVISTSTSYCRVTIVPRQRGKSRSRNASVYPRVVSVSDTVPLQFTLLQSSSHRAEQSLRDPLGWLRIEK